MAVRRSGATTKGRPGGAWRAQALAVIIGIAAWYLLTVFATRVPQPHEVLAAMVQVVTDPHSYGDFLTTARRIVLGFVCGVFLGACFGIAMGWRARVNAFFNPVSTIGLAIPSAVMVISCTLILGFNETSLIIALVLSVIPYVITLTSSAVRSLDLSLLDMSYVFRISTRERWRQVILPQLVPALFAAIRVAFAVSWKFIVVIEAIATSTGVGARILFSFVRLQPETMIAWALLFTLVMWLVEVLVFARIERYLFRWRSESAIGARSNDDRQSSE